MRDDDLREGLRTLLRPIREAAPPDLPVIRRRARRRARRRRARIATTSATAVAVAVAAGVHGARPAAVPGTPGTPYTVSGADALVVTGGVGSVSIEGGSRTTISVVPARHRRRDPDRIDHRGAGRA